MTRRATRSRATGSLAALAGMVVLSACSGHAAPGAPADAGSVPPGREASDEGPSALEGRFDDRLPEPLVDPEDVRSGGPPPDGIPPIDEPSFEAAEAVTWLEPDEAVLSLTVEGETRAYPLRIMTWHEIVNDTVAGVPVAVTYCPLCNSGVAFVRKAGGRVLTFGTSGMLYADNLVMYDRQTESLWPQLTGEAAIGVLTGQRLDAIPMGTVAWSDFREGHPESLVLSQDTGFDRRYGANPYVGYDNPNGGLLFGLPDDPDQRLPIKQRVIGLAAGSASVAVVRVGLEGRGPLDVRVGRGVLTLWHLPGQRSALDAPDIADGDDIGTVRVFDPVVEGRRLHFTRRDRLFRDEETGSLWNILGRSVRGPLKGSVLSPAEHLDTFWFAWATFHPDTTLVDPRPDS